MGQASLERKPGKQYGPRGGFRKQEYVADFCLTAKRTLRSNPDLLKLFQLRFVYGKDSAQCRKTLALTSSMFFERSSQIEEQLGRVFRELRPHALFPTDEYFGVSAGRGKPKIVKIRRETPCNATDLEVSDKPLAA